MTTPQAQGWYDDPDGSDALRYFDGEVWTPQRKRRPAAPQTAPQYPSAGQSIPSSMAGVTPPAPPGFAPPPVPADAYGSPGQTESDVAYGAPPWTPSSSPYQYWGTPPAALPGWAGKLKIDLNSRRHQLILGGSIAGCLIFIAVVVMAVVHNGKQEYEAQKVREIEASVRSDAIRKLGERVADVSCDPVSTAEMGGVRTTTFECFVELRHNVDGTASGNYYHARINWKTGDYTYGPGRAK